MSAVLDSIKSFRDGAFADLMVSSGSGPRAQNYELHRVIVCPQSTAFNDICRAPMNLNAPSTKYTLPKEFKPEIFDKLVQFWYTGNYQDEDHYQPLINAPELAWSMSPDELEAALEPSGEKVGTHEIICCDYPGKEDEEDEEEEEEEEEEGEDDAEEEDVEEEEGKGGWEEEDDESDTSEESGDTEMCEATEVADLEDELSKDTNGLDGTRSALKTSMHVFITADYFGVMALKLVAIERFYQCVEREMVKDFDSAELSACVRELYITPDPSGMLAPLKEIIVACFHTILPYKTENIMAIIVQHVELSVELLKYNVRAQVTKV